MPLTASNIYSSENIFYFLKKSIHNFLSPKDVDQPAISLPEIPTVNRDPKDFTQIGKEDDRKNYPFYKQLTRKQRIELAIGVINELYLVILGRYPKMEERKNKVNVLLQKGSREGIYHALVLGQEYRYDESVENLLSDQNKKFLSHHFEMFLGLKIDRTKLKKMDFHTAKRLVIARSLEVIDAFDRRAHVDSWFSVFSETMAKKLEWEQKHRKMTSRKHYFHWAQKIPLDILKSEVIIKIHHLMNSLQ